MCSPLALIRSNKIISCQVDNMLTWHRYLVDLWVNVTHTDLDDNYNESPLSLWHMQGSKLKNLEAVITRMPLSVSVVHTRAQARSNMTK